MKILATRLLVWNDVDILFSELQPEGVPTLKASPRMSVLSVTACQIFVVCVLVQAHVVNGTGDVNLGVSRLCFECVVIDFSHFTASYYLPKTLHGKLTKMLGVSQKAWFYA